MFSCTNRDAERFAPTSPTAPHEDAGRELVSRFADAVRGESAGALVPLCGATITLATSMRRAGLPPERALIALKELVRGGGTPGWTPSLLLQEHDDDFRHRQDRIYEYLFHCWMKGYFPASP